MDVRLVQLLGSFITARNQYALARLEFAMRHAADPAPPVIDRLLEPSQRAMRDEWPHVARQLETALAFANQLERAARESRSTDEGYRRLQRSLRELDQYARAITWVVTITESESG